MSSTDDEDVGNLVVIVIDVNPVWWGKQSHHKQQVNCKNNKYSAYSMMIQCAELGLKSKDDMNLIQVFQ